VIYWAGHSDQVGLQCRHAKGQIPVWMALPARTRFIDRSAPALRIEIGLQWHAGKQRRSRATNRHAFSRREFGLLSIDSGVH
jgi:hypothetical protein